ncbi:hypothetical protein H6G41_12390 [Tolypothrix sp. FACHB-123]|nr:hypothetical protein [Tolypothrix sp. FACHB-123]
MRAERCRQGGFEQIREALNLLKDFLKILEYNRIHTQGSDDWHFSLKLWSRDKEKNLKQLRIIVGWVERSETQQATGNVGFRSSTQPTPF